MTMRWEGCAREPSWCRLDILLNGEVVDALSMIVPRGHRLRQGPPHLAEKLKENIPRAAVRDSCPGGRAAARSLPARPSRPCARTCLAKCYGGDITRKKKLLEKQKEGKKKMRQLGSVTLPSEAFTAVLKLDSDS